MLAPSTLPPADDGGPLPTTRWNGDVRVGEVVLLGRPVPSRGDTRCSLASTRWARPRALPCELVRDSAEAHNWDHHRRTERAGELGVCRFAPVIPNLTRRFHPTEEIRVANASQLAWAVAEELRLANDIWTGPLRLSGPRHPVAQVRRGAQRPLFPNL